MKNAIRYYYELEVTNLDYKDQRYSFDSYTLIEIEKMVDLGLYQFLLDNHYPLYPIVQNRNREYVTKIDGKKYLLLSTKDKKRVTFETIEQFQIPLYQEEILPWHQLWMDKVDFYEKHVQTVSSKKLKDSFFYYIGMTENAISYYQIIKKKRQLYVSHNRMENDFDFWNPINFTIDYRVRDIAEYTKMMFFSNQLELSNVFYYFYRNQFTEDDYLLFYVRMLYPSYYYDCYDSIVNGALDNCLNKYLDNIDDYERLLKELYYYFSQNTFLPKIDWIVEQ